MVILAHAGTDPWTVMVEFLDADVALVAVGCSWRSVDTALAAEF